MALIPVVGRRSWKMRALILLLYVVLSLGAVTMVYPFLVMLGASITSQYDQDKYDIIPRYLLSERALYGKYAEDKFGGDISKITAAYSINAAKLTDVVPPPSFSASRIHDWNAFVTALPARYKAAGFVGDGAAYSPSLLLDWYHAFLQRRFHGDIRALDKAYTEEDETFQTVFPPFEQPTKHNWTPDTGPKGRDWAKFKTTLPLNFFYVIGGDPIFQKWLKEEAYPTLDALNKAWGSSYKAFTDITLPAHPVGNNTQKKDWQTFVRTNLPFRDTHVDAAALPTYQAFLQSRYKNDLAAYNHQHQAQVGAWTQITLPDPEALPPGGSPLLDWFDFLKVAPPASLSADTAELRYRAYAQNRYNLPLQSLMTLPMPQAQADWAYVQSHAGALRRDFMARNYSLVLQYIILHGRAVFNTVVYCGLAILTALIVNPLCAYALSRYNLSYGNALLLFLLATMAFPAEVAMIPSFLLLKQLNLLNTFAALILPGAASGFSIFLMKGFFDSLPKELYEAGMLDGAGEVRMFWNITLPLSKPIFAVIALQAFTGAYGAFLFALLVCQDSKMWTMMVWLYELQAGGAPQYVMMAALTLAAIPTLLVFIFAQNTIMKGIILPSYK